MKKIALFVAALAVSSGIGGKVLADTSTATLADKAGITPDNTILYPIDKAIDNIRINITFGDDKKAKVLVDIAEERLGESEVMSDKGKTDLANQAMNEYSDKMAEAQDKIENDIDEASNSITNSTTGSAISNTIDNAAKLDQLKAVETEIDNDQTYSIEVLKNIENKVSGNAKETIAQVIEMQTRKKEAIAAVIKERQTLLQDKSAVKAAEKNLEQAKKSGDDQALKAAEDALKQAKDALNTENEKLSQAIAAKKEAMKGGVGQLKKQAKQAENNQNDQTNNTTSGSNNTTSTPTTTTSNTAGTLTSNTVVTNETNTYKSIEKNKGQEIKAQKEKENKGQEMKAKKANSSSHEDNSRD